MIFEPFDVAVVQFPYADMPVVRKRPAIILSGHLAFGAFSGAVITAMVSAPLASSWPLDVSLTDIDCAGLYKPSIVRMKLMTIDVRLIDRKLGALGAIDRQAVRAALQGVLAAVL